MSCLIILFTILSAFSNGFLGRYVGVTGSHIIAVIILFFSLLTLLLTIIDFLFAGNIYFSFFPFINSGLLNADWSLQLDSLSLSLMFPVVLISFCVHLYSVNYIAHDPHSQRFIAYLSLFTASMLLLVSSSSLLQLFVGWELIGLSSYLLIGFWYTRLSASQSALQAFIINRIGDVALSIAIYFSYLLCNSINFNSIIAVSAQTTCYTLIVITLLIAAIAKSAQFGLQTWLPQAMEGPTPVSALIHAATLVTAGAFLLLRLSPILDQSDSILIFTGIIGSLTAVFAGTVGFLQNDLKRIIAFSTCSQIGYLFIAIGAGEFNIALFHIINHAIFKALLFLGAGAVIHSIGDNQDIRRIGGLIFFLPIAYISLIVGSLSLIALPFLTGFYSKELIIELNFVQFTVLPLVLYCLATFAAALTGYYSMRLIYMTFYSKAHARPSVYYSIHSRFADDLFINITLIILLIFSVSIGFLLKDMYTGVGSPFLSNNLPTNSHLTEVEFFISPIIKLIPLVVTLIAGSIGLFSPYFIAYNNWSYSFYRFLSVKWGLDHIINYFAYFILHLALIISKVIDRGLIEIVGPFGVSSLLVQTSSSITTSLNLSRYCIIIIVTLLLSVSGSAFHFASLLLTALFFI